MIVKRLWLTHEKTNVGHYRIKVSKWRGLFLFGFIPLYLWMTEYEYQS